MNDPANLAAACSPCNQAKSNAVLGYDVVTATEVRLFNPRRDRWSEHFAWANDYLRIDGVTSVGRATVARLKLNRAVYRSQRRLLRAAMRGGSDPWP
jgi:hypothetical protein